MPILPISINMKNALLSSKAFLWCAISGRVKKTLLRSVFSDRSPRAKAERLRERRSRPRQGDGAAKNPGLPTGTFLVRHQRARIENAPAERF